MTAKYKKFFNSLVSLLNNYDNNDIKAAIGDSTNNHRVPTVNQVVRFLDTRRNLGLKTLGEDLSTAYDFLKEDIQDIRLENNLRTDAIDINEFIDTYNAIIILGDDTELKKTLSKSLVGA